MFKSEPIVFTNVNPPQDKKASDQASLFIEHGDYSQDTY
jgi:hypothetical protein